MGCYGVCVGVLCCAVLCFVVSRCVVLCFVVLGCVVLCCVVLCCCGGVGGLHIIISGSYIAWLLLPPFFLGFHRTS